MLVAPSGQSNDLAAPTDCNDNSAAYDDVHVAELEAFSTGADGSDPGPPGGPKDPVVVLTKTAPLTAAPGSDVSYTVSWTNLGPETASSARVTDAIPNALRFVSASGGGVFNTQSRTVRWNVGDVPVGETGTRSLVVRVRGATSPGTLLLNQAQFTAPLTVANPAAALTLVQ